MTYKKTIEALTHAYHSARMTPDGPMQAAYAVARDAVMEELE